MNSIPGFHTVMLNESSQAKIPSMLLVMTRSNAACVCELVSRFASRFSAD
jgi:hypothetical protein